MITVFLTIRSLIRIIRVMASLVTYITPYFPEDEESGWDFNDTVQRRRGS